jgi:hypothetical protein
MMQRRRNLIRVFTLARRCFTYKHVLSAPRDKQSPSTYSTKELNSSRRKTPKEKKIRRGECGCMIQKDLALGSGACTQEILQGKRQSEF